MSGNVMQTFKNTCFLCEIRQSHADYILYILKEYLWPKCIKSICLPCWY